MAGSRSRGEAARTRVTRAATRVMVAEEIWRRGSRRGCNKDHPASLRVNHPNINHNHLYHRRRPHRNPTPKHHRPHRNRSNHSSPCARRSASTPTLVVTTRGRGRGWGRRRRRLSPGIRQGRCCSATVIGRSSARGVSKGGRGKGRGT